MRGDLGAAGARLGVPSCVACRASNGVCRCPVVPKQSMKTAAALFTRVGTCGAGPPAPDVDTAAKDTASRHLRAGGRPSVHSFLSRRRLLDGAGAPDPVFAADSSPPEVHELESMGAVNPAELAGMHELGEAEVEGPVHDLEERADEEAGQQNLAEQVLVESPEESGVAEVGEERDAQDAAWAEGIHREMSGNLRAQGWLGQYEPMHMHCPLLARKVSADAVSQFAEAAWRCDGLGFAWQCL